MTNQESKTAEVTPPTDPANSMVGSSETGENKAASESMISAANVSGGGDTPNAPALEPPRCLSREEVEAQNQKRQIEFPTRTAGLVVLANIGSNLAESAVKYRSNLQALYDDLALICKVLHSTLDAPLDPIYYSVHSHEWLLKQSALALNGLANVIDIMEPLLKTPVQTTELRRIASHLYFIIDPDVKFNHTKATEQHWAEVELAESGLCDLKQQVNNLKGFIEVRRSPPLPTSEDFVSFRQIRDRLKQQQRGVSLKTVQNLAKSDNWGQPVAKGSGGKHLYDWRVIQLKLELRYDVTFPEYPLTKEG